MKHFLIFGRLPLISLAEAKAVIGGQKPDLAGDMAVFERPTWDGAWLQDRLAGTVKLGEVVADIPIKELTPERVVEEIAARPRGKKVEFGLIVYGGSSAARTKMKNVPLKVKRVLQEQGHTVRWVTGERGEVTPAAVAKADLINQGYDICIGLFGTRAVIGLTTHVQDADAWSKRDYGRPFRDEITGMLPPKLARTMVNLAVGSEGGKNILLDPFCGGGTVLMEAILMKVGSVIGSDLDEKQVRGAKQNLEWLVRERLIAPEAHGRVEIFQQPAERIGEEVKQADAIVTEGYLGKPLTGQETLATLKKQKQEIEDLWRASFQAFAKIQKQGDRVVCVWPVFASSHGTLAVDVKNELENLGYRLVDPLAGWTEKPATLTYSREGQRVKRNILVLEKK